MHCVKLNIAVLTHACIELSRCFIYKATNFSSSQRSTSPSFISSSQSHQLILMIKTGPLGDEKFCDHHHHHHHRHHHHHHQTHQLILMIKTGPLGDKKSRDVQMTSSSGSLQGCVPRLRKVIMILDPFYFFLMTFIDLSLILSLIVLIARAVKETRNR